MSHLQTNCCLKPYSQEQNGQIIQAEVHVTKHRKDNHLQSTKLCSRISWLRIQIWRKRSTNGSMLNQIS